MSVLNFKNKIIQLLENNGSDEDIDNVLTDYINEGGTRNEVYKSLNEIFLMEESMIKKNIKLQDQFDYLGELQTTITGYCSPNSIVKFKNEPTTNMDDFLNYVRGEKWKV
ncbi:hypothetical protein [Acinetobacter sp.]|jgi:hypothetical protein|uniref:hypothetical protein n=1 Tax=Acinetobacter sp. TaxID=472 RepID=UPI0028313B75|nr:hypothetical protein [Acinetobacter sp.]MDR0235251.1 hypothetical protein [Acinetobacter sp.]